MPLPCFNSQDVVSINVSALLDLHFDVSCNESVMRRDLLLMPKRS